jgi:hypothetical protein
MLLCTSFYAFFETRLQQPWLYVLQQKLFMFFAFFVTSYGCYLNDKTQYLSKIEDRLPEEGMMFHTAFPEMFAGLPRRSLKPVRAFLVLEKIREIKKKQQRSSLFSNPPEYVILDDFLSFYPGYTRALPGVFQWPRIFHILNKFAITRGNCILPRVFARTWGRNISWL